MTTPTEPQYDLWNLPPMSVRLAQIGAFMDRPENQAHADELDDIIDELTGDNTDEVLRGQLWTEVESLIHNALHSRPKRVKE